MPLIKASTLNSYKVIDFLIRTVKKIIDIISSEPPLLLVRLPITIFLAQERLKNLEGQ